MTSSQHPQGSPGDVTGGRRANWLRAVAIFCASFLFYAVLPSRNWNYADDSLSWAYRITTPSGLISVHHLFFNVMRLLYHGLTATLGRPVDPAQLLTLYCTFWGAIGLVFLDVLLRLAGLGRVALLGTLVCAFTVGYWSYCIVGDVYVPATALMISGAYWFCRGLKSGEPRVLCGTFATLSLILMMFHHQAYFAFAVGLVPGTLAVRALDRGKFAYAIAVVAAAGALVLSTYLAIYVRGGHHEPVRAFLSGYAGRNDWRPDQMRITPSTLIGAAAGEVRAVVSTNLMFRSEALTRKIQARYPYRNVYPYPYLVRNLSLPAAALIAIAIALAVLVATPLVLRGLWSGLRGRDTLAVLFIAAVFQALLFTWWEAISDEFWIWSTPVFACAVAAGAAAFGRRDRVLAGLVAGGLFVSSLLGSIALFADPANDIDAVNARYVARLGPQDLLIGFDEIQTCDRIMLAQRSQGFQYFNIRVRTEDWSNADDQELDRTVAGALARKGRVIVGPYVLHPPLSNMVSIRIVNPQFDRKLQGVITRLAALDPARVTWVPMAASPPGWFRPPPGGAGREAQP